MLPTIYHVIAVLLPLRLLSPPLLFSSSSPALPPSRYSALRKSFRAPSIFTPQVGAHPTPGPSISTNHPTPRSPTFNVHINSFCTTPTPSFTLQTPPNHITPTSNSRNLLSAEGRGSLEIPTGAGMSLNACKLTWRERLTWKLRGEGRGGGSGGSGREG
eukprot:753249-Hanusia_phi.AAC.3